MALMSTNFDKPKQDVIKASVPRDIAEKFIKNLILQLAQMGVKKGTLTADKIPAFEKLLTPKQFAKQVTNLVKHASEGELNRVILESASK